MSLRREVVAALDADAFDDAAGGDRIREDAETRLSRDDLGEVAQQQLEARVRLVDAVAVHRLPPGHARERHGQPAAAEIARVPCARDRVLERGEDVVLVDEGHLDVELRELRLAVGAQVLVAHAVRELEVPVEAGDHGKLLVQLR